MVVQERDFPILVVDDDPEIRSSLKRLLSSEGYQVEIAAEASEAINILKKIDIPLVLSDIMMPDINGIELLKEIKSSNSETIVVLMTGYSSIQGAIDAIKAGAQDYLIKPIKFDNLMLMVERNYQQYQKNKRSEMVRQELLRDKTRSIIGRSTKIKNVKLEIAQVAPSDMSILITGESGTGKELVAQAIHDLSPRKEKMFVAINCASIPSDLLESELFGHEKGAFSGAVKRKYGLFEIADEGTIFLDEIGDMPAELQAKLLRTTESGVFRRLGGTQEICSNFRLLSATNRDLQVAIKTKHFRSDLFYRLNQFHISVPPLRDRLLDIELLVDYYAAKNGKPADYVQNIPECLNLLRNYHWPGNIRELFNVLDRAFLLSDGDSLDHHHFPTSITDRSLSGQQDEAASMLLADIENEHIRKIFYKMNQHRARTAEALGISVRSLYNKLSYRDNNSF